MTHDEDNTARGSYRSREWRLRGGKSTTIEMNEIKRERMTIGDDLCSLKSGGGGVERRELGRSKKYSKATKLIAIFGRQTNSTSPPLHFLASLPSTHPSSLPSPIFILCSPPIIMSSVAYDPKVRSLSYTVLSVVVLLTFDDAILRTCDSSVSVVSCFATPSLFQDRLLINRHSSQRLAF